MPQPDALDLQQGYLEEMNSVNLTVSSNIPWKVQVWTESSDMGQSDDGSVTKFIKTLRWIPPSSLGGGKRRFAEGESACCS